MHWFAMSDECFVYERRGPVAVITSRWSTRLPQMLGNSEQIEGMTVTIRTRAPAFNRD